MIICFSFILISLNFRCMKKTLTQSNQQILDNYINEPKKYLPKVKKNLKLAKENKDLENELFALYLEGAIYLRISNYKKAESIANDVIQKSNKTDFYLQKGNAYKLMTIICNQTSRHTDALEYAKTALKNYKKSEDIGCLADIFFNIGESYMLLANYNTALDNAFISMNHNLEIDRYKGLIYSYNLIGTCHYMLKNLSEATKYIKLSLKHIKTTPNKNLEMRNYVILGGIALEIPDIDKAIDYLYKSKEIAEEINATDMVVNSTLNIGEVYFQMPNYKEAYNHYKLAFNESKKIKNAQIELVALVNLAKVCLQLDKPSETVEWSKKAIEITSKIESKQYQLYAYLFMHEAFLMLNKPVEAQEALIQHDMLNQHVSNSDIIHKAIQKTQDMEDEKDSKALKRFQKKKEQFLEEKKEFTNLFETLSDGQKQIMLLYAQYKKPLEIEEITRYKVEAIKTYRHQSKNKLKVKTFEEAIVKINLFILNPIW